jgi:hypothetical protein
VRREPSRRRRPHPKALCRSRTVRDPSLGHLYGLPRREVDSRFFCSDGPVGRHPSSSRLAAVTSATTFSSLRLSQRECGSPRRQCKNESHKFDGHTQTNTDSVPFFAFPVAAEPALSGVERACRLRLGHFLLLSCYFADAILPDSSRSGLSIAAPSGSPRRSTQLARRIAFSRARRQSFQRFSFSRGKC